MKKILFATHNQGKLNEVKNIFANKNIEILSMEDFDLHDVEILEDGNSFESNSYKKASEIHKIVGIPVLADDSGLCVDSLDMEPGIYSARYAGKDSDDEKNNDKLLYELAKTGSTNRNARFVCVMTLVGYSKEAIVCRGEVEGRILKERCGDGGFGYDPIFYCYELNKCFGECSPEEKNKVSHRYKALVSLYNVLTSS